MIILIIKQTTPEQAAAHTPSYDAVIVGSGISGSILAKELTENGQTVLMLEAGPAKDLSFEGFKKYLSNFYLSVSKDKNSPYPKNPNARMPRSAEVSKLIPGKPDDKDYLVQNGPMVNDSTYTRVTGGTTMHWEGKTPRMLPDDFNTRSRFGVGLDWPITYKDLMPYYRKAEFAMGISANIKDQIFLGLTFESKYVYPMHELPSSYLDHVVAEGVDGMKFDVGDKEPRSIKVRTYPQARNSIPNDDYDNGKGYSPVGAVSANQVEQGERCQGNMNCVPICPIQAKFDARKILVSANKTGRLDFMAQAVASKICVDKESNKISHIEYKKYKTTTSPKYRTEKVSGKIFIIATHAVENARLMLASGLPSSSGLVGKNLMDHIFLRVWGLLPKAAGTMRGTKCTSGISDLRTGPFRNKRTPFAIDINNDGWGSSTGAPFTDIEFLVDDQNKFGRKLRKGVIDRISNQLQLSYMLEQPADESNRITIDASYKDALGNPRPIISYNISDYSRAGVAFARETGRMIFQRLGVEDHSNYSPLEYNYFDYEGEGYYTRGGDHFSGTHIMGTSLENSVVNSKQQSWDHENLYLIGSGSMPSIGTSNTTVTLAALCFMTAEHILKIFNNTKEQEENT